MNVRSDADRRRAANAGGHWTARCVCPVIVTLLTLTLALCSACAPREVVTPEISRGAVATPLPFGTEAKGRLAGKRDRYLVRVDDPGVVSLDISWNNQEALERVEWSGPPPGGVVIIDGRDKLELQRRLPVTPGFYYIEVVPWEGRGAYRMLASFRKQ